MKKMYSYELERRYYSNWPKEARSYLYLEPYLRCWLNPEEVFGGKRVLDLGAGECPYTNLIATRFAPKRMVALELFPERLLPAANTNQKKNLRFVAGDCFKLPFKSGSFDVLFGSLTLSQLRPLEQVIGEIQRVLVAGGMYVGIEPNPYNPVHLYRYFFRKHSPNQYLLNRKDLAKFEAAGFQLDIRHFYARFPRLRNRLLTSCLGIQARFKGPKRA